MSTELEDGLDGPVHLATRAGTTPPSTRRSASRRLTDGVLAGIGAAVVFAAVLDALRWVAERLAERSAGE